MSEIRHEWTGSVLTITSDSGTSAADLKGPKGDTGPRGPQGPAGIILDEEGNVKVDLSKYYTSDEVDAKLENVDLEGYATEEYVRLQVANVKPDLTDYATKNYVSTQIAQAQLGGEGGSVDLSGYATKDDLANVKVNIDNKTIIRDDSGAIKTALGGGEYTTGTEVFKTSTNTWYRETTHTGGSNSLDWVVGTCEALQLDKSYTFVWTDNKGNVETFLLSCSIADCLHGCLFWRMKTADGAYKEVYVLPEAPHTVYVNYNANIPNTYVSLGIYEGEIGHVVEPINAKFIPVDGSSIIVNEDGKLAAVGGGSGEDTPVDLSNYYTKAEVDANYYTKAQVDAIALNGTVDLGGYYTKAEIDALLAQIETYPSAEEVEY